MIKLNTAKDGETGWVASIKGNTRFLNRITSIGLTIGSEIEIIQNQEKCPVLIFNRDTVIAINRSECEKIMVEVIER